VVAQAQLGEVNPMIHTRFLVRLGDKRTEFSRGDIYESRHGLYIVLRVEYFENSNTTRVTLGRC
jgi:hypothetical protein